MSTVDHLNRCYALECYIDEDSFLEHVDGELEKFETPTDDKLPLTDYLRFYNTCTDPIEKQRLYLKICHTWENIIDSPEKFRLLSDIVKDSYIPGCLD